MSTTDDRIEELAFLARSKTRVSILDELERDGSLKKQALRNRIDCDRTTLQRNLDALVEHGWVEQTNRTYRITQPGKLFATGLFDCLETTGTAMELKPFLRWMPDDAFGFDVELLADADITVSGPDHPDRVIYKHIDVLQATDRFRGFIPFIGRHSLETVWRRVTNGDGIFEVVVPAEGVRSLQSEPEHAEMFDELLEADRIDILATRNDIPFYLGILDDVVQIGNKTDNGMRRAMLETDHDTVRAWAVDTYETYKRQASPLDRGSGTDPGLGP